MSAMLVELGPQFVHITLEMPLYPLVFYIIEVRGILSTILPHSNLSS